MEEEVINQVMIVDSSIETSDESSQRNIVGNPDRKIIKRYTVTDTNLAVRDIKVEEVVDGSVVTVSNYTKTTVMKKNIETFEEQMSHSPPSFASTSSSSSSSKRFADVSGSSREERDRPIGRNVQDSIDRASQEQAYVQRIFPETFLSDSNAVMALSTFSPISSQREGICSTEFPSLGSSPVEGSRDSRFKFPRSHFRLPKHGHKKSARFSSSTSISEEDRLSLAGRSFIPEDISSIHQSVDVGLMNLSSDGDKISPELNLQSEAECKSPSIISHPKTNRQSDSSRDSSFPILEESSEMSLDIIPPTESDVSDKGGVGLTKRMRRPRLPIKRYSLVRRLSTIVGSPATLEAGEENVRNKQLVHGTLVYTRWTDGHFYPGRVDRVVDPDDDHDGTRFGVLFDDGHMHEARRCDIVTCDLVSMGSAVMAERNEEVAVLQPGPSTPRGRRSHWSEVAEVMGHMNRADGSKSYLVKFVDRKESIVERKKVTLTLSQASRVFGMKFKFMDHRDLKSPDVSSDNMVEGKRKRRPPTPLSQSEKRELIRDSMTSPKRIKRIKRMASSAPRTKKKKYTMMKERSDTFDPCPPVIICSPSTHHRPVGDKQSAKRVLDLSCQPVKVVMDIFKGKTFIITHVWKSPSQLERERSLLNPSSSLSSCSLEFMESQSEAGLAMMNRDLIIDLIRDGGGTILEDFNIEAVNKCKDTCFLISDSAQRTIKYFCCLAFGIPCVSHLWVVHSANHSKLENHMLYLLPVGYSIEKERMLIRDHHHHLPSPLNGQHVLLRLRNDATIAAWRKVLLAAGCKVTVARGNEGLIDHLKRAITRTFLVTDSVPRDGDEESPISRAGLTLVSTEWVIQCIINEKIMDPLESPKYRP